MALVVTLHGVALDSATGVPEGVGNVVARLLHVGLSLLGAAFGFQIGVVRRIASAGPWPCRRALLPCARSCLPNP